jgi:hypothetical protein
VYVDNLYVDNTLARVEIGNAATYSGSTYREIQIPQTTWSSNSIHIKVNTGTFSNGQAAYLYVSDSSGNINANGFPITISATTVVDITAPAAPTNLSTGGN